MVDWSILIPVTLKLSVVVTPITFKNPVVVTPVTPNVAMVAIPVTFKLVKFVLSILISVTVKIPIKPFVAVTNPTDVIPVILILPPALPIVKLPAEVSIVLSFVMPIWTLSIFAPPLAVIVPVKVLVSFTVRFLVVVRSSTPNVVMVDMPTFR